MYFFSFDATILVNKDVYMKKTVFDGEPSIVMPSSGKRFY